MRRLVLCLFIQILFSNLFVAQNEWSYSFGSIKEDEIMDICYDQTGNIITVGYFSGPTQFATGVVLSSTGLGIPDIYITKSTPSGSLLWVKKAGGTGSDRALSVACDASNNIFITGFYYGAANFGSTTLNSASGSQDGFISKLDPSGNFLWAQSFGGNLAEWGNAIAVDELGNPVITGQFQGSSSFGSTTLTSMTNPNTLSPSFDVFTAKYSSAGVLTWVNKGSAKYDDRGLDIITDLSNNIYVCGQFSDTIQFQSQHNNQIMNASFFIKYNAAGQEQWFRKATGVFSIPYSMVMDNNNNIYVTGDFQGTYTYFGTSGNSFINGTYSNKAFLLKIDNNGNFKWGKSESSNSYVSGKKVALDAQQDPYIFGEFYCTMNEYSDAYGTGIFNSIGFGDFFITKYNSTGTRQWFRHYGGPRNDKAHGLLLAGINQPIMAGSYEHHLSIPATYGIMSQLNNPGAYITPINQPYVYCSESNYPAYHDLMCKGYSDGYLYKGLDTTKNLYDYYDRSGTNCNLDFVPSCISNSASFCPDTITFCVQGQINAQTHTNRSAYKPGGVSSSSYANNNIGPIHKFYWNNNTFYDTLGYINVNTSGYNTVKVQTLDECYTSFDTVYVKINPLPAPPVISDSYSVNILQPPPTHSIHVCGPATITLTGGPGSNPTYNWTGGTFLSMHDSVAVVNMSGVYFFNVTDANGCSNFNKIKIKIDDSIAVFVPEQKNDTLNLCFGDYKKHFICDTISNPTLAYPYPSSNSCVDFNGSFIVSQSPGLTISNPSNCDLSTMLTASATGNYTYTIGYVINNLCVHDTIYYTAHIYIIVNQKPHGLINVTGNTMLCPGDTTLLSASVYSLSSSSVIYTLSPTSMNVTTSGTEHFSAYLLDTITGCHKNIGTSIMVHIKPNPFIILNPYNAIICPNDSVSLTLNISGATNYEWHGPQGIIPSNAPMIYQNIAGFYHCVVTDSTGCVFTTNTVELKQYATPYLISTPNNVMCNNQPITLSVVTLDPNSVVWNAPLSGGGITKVVTNPGVYSCQVTMCGITTSLSINITGSNPTAVISTFGPTTVCPFDSVLLTGNPGMANYVWQPGNHIGQNYMVHTPGTYTLEVTDIYGCTQKSSPVTVTFTSNVAPPLSAINDTICAGQTATLSVVNSGTNTLQWFPNANSGNVIQTGNTYITPVLNNQTTYYVSNMDSSGCHSVGIPVTAYVYPTSLPPNIIADTTVCNGDTLMIFTDDISGASYNWSGPGITSSNNSSSIKIPNADSSLAGIYSVQISGNGCTSPTATIAIHVLNPQNPSLLLNSDTLCTGQTYLNTINPSLVNYAYQWSGPNNYSHIGDSLFFASVTPSLSGTYSVYADLFGCKSLSDSVQITVINPPPTPTVTSNSPVCVGDTIVLTAISNSATIYNWAGSNGFTATGDSVMFVASSATLSGYYGVVAYNNACYSPIGFDSVIVVDAPIIVASDDTLGCETSIITLTCTSNYNNYSWSNGSTGTSINVTQSGTYWVSSQNGNCVTTDSIHVTLINCTSFDVNVFTPNGDGVNDVFMFNSKAITDIHCEIRNRWGEKVGEFNDNNIGWNGKNMNNGKDCEPGTYFYVVTLQTIEGVSKTIKGFVTLIK